MTHRTLTTAALLALVGCAGKADDDPTDTDGHEHEAAPFSLRFAAAASGEPVECGTPVGGLGPQGQHEVGLSDLRFYVSNLQLWDAAGAAVEATFDEDEFQYTGVAGWVALVDLTSDTAGDCAATAISFSEGTALIGSNTAEAAPSPLGEMYWSWATGYRHFVLNLTVSDGVDDGEGYVHVGSTACAGTGYLALEDREVCDFVNTAKVELADFDLASDVVHDLVTQIMDPVTYQTIGEAPGAECHSMPMQEDCAQVFDNLGIDLSTGASTAAGNSVFGRG
jgi:hypothetical protein